MGSIQILCTSRMATSLSRLTFGNCMGLWPENGSTSLPMNTPIILIWRWSNESIFKVDYVRRQNLLDLEWTHLGHILGTVPVES